eukprot:m51a1_g5264 hypothetical protein (137) ;mRNA; f:120312-120827
MRTVNDTSRQIEEYAAALRYQVSKLAEIVLSGALLVTDLPFQDEVFWSRVAVQISASDSDESIGGTVQWWLDHDREHVEHVRAAQRMVVRRYTTDHTALVLLHSLQMWRQRNYGYWMPYPYSHHCADTPESKMYCS